MDKPSLEVSIGSMEEVVIALIVRQKPSFQQVLIVVFCTQTVPE